MDCFISKCVHHLQRFNSIWSIICLCSLNLLFMHYSILYACHLETEIDITSIFDNLLGVCFDVCFLFILCYFFSLRNSKITPCICFIITWLWSLSNIIYSRFFYHYLSLSAIEQGGVLTEKLIINCIIDSLRLSDIYYLVVAILFILVLVRLQTAERNWTLRNILLLLCISVVADICVHAANCIYNPQNRYVSYFTHRLYLRHFATHRTWSQQNLVHFIRGDIRTICGDLIIDLQGTIDLSSGQIKKITEETSKAHSSQTNEIKISPRNIILIIVESYMSFTSDMKVNGKEITPFLNSLKSESYVYYNGKMCENVTIGESSDGQFIYMTGILPLKSDVTVSKVRKNKLPGLPKLLGRESRMIIPTTTSVWSQDEMCRQYGFDHLYTCNDYKEKKGTDLNDEEVFRLAFQKDKASNLPFFSVILTMSMHGPYNKIIDPSFHVTDPSLSNDLAFYLNACHYTDHQIKQYFNQLKAMNLFNNSLIIIAADHHVHKADFGVVCGHLPLYIIHKNGLPDNMWQDECNQLDLYTTLLDLLGCKSNWHGLGYSLVSPRYKNNISENTWKVSEWIIRGDYFSKSSY